MSAEVVVVIVLLFSLCIYSTARAQSTGFTYQGRLADSGTPTNGNYDLQFALWNSLSGGGQVGSTQTINSVAVSSGVFTVNLDFGASAFPGASRFLEISVRPAGVGSFTTLTPRQPITSTPYAVRSLNAATADSVPASGVPPGSGNYIQNTLALQASTNFNISGNGTAGGTLTGNAVNATIEYDINGSRVLSNGGTNNLFVGVKAGIANSTGFHNTFVGSFAGSANTEGNFNSFFGQGAGLKNTTGQQNSFFGLAAGQANTSGDTNSFFGSFAGTDNTTGIDNAFYGDSAGTRNLSGDLNSFFGHAAGLTNISGQQNVFLGAFTGLTATGNFNTFVGSSADFANLPDSSTSGIRNTLLGANAVLGSSGIFSPNNATAIGANARVDNSNSLVLGSIKNVNGASADTNVGIGTTAPTTKLSVVATGDGARLILLGTERAWVFRQFGTGAAAALELTADDANNNNKNFLINTQGNVGVGTQGPLDKLHVIGDIRVGVFGTNGCLKNNNGGMIVGTCSSDARFKRNIVAFDPTLQNIIRLQPKYFFWRTSEFPNKNFGPARETGLIAQEVEQVLPELVSEDSEGFKQVDYSKLPLMLLQAVKEQQNQIGEQHKQIVGLKKLVCRSRRKAAACKSTLLN